MSDADACRRLPTPADVYRAALQEVRAKILVADAAGVRNEAGYLTDSSLWAREALRVIDAALETEGGR